MKSQTLLTVLVLASACLSAHSQQKDHDEVRRVRPAARGHWMGRLLGSPEFMEKVGIQGEQAAKLKTVLDELDKDSQKLDDSINQAASEQAEIAKKVLSETGANTDEMMKIIERIGKMRTEQAKLATKRLVVMRDHLTPEQRQKALNVLNQEQQKWREPHDKAAAPGRPAEQAKRPATQPPRPAVPKGW